MSSIFGIFNRDGTTPDPDSVESMLQANLYWNPDRVGTWCEGGAALGHCLLWNTPESRLENQPLVFHKARNKTVLVADARLDNRSELADLFGLNCGELENSTDPDLIMMAWKKWGRNCPAHLLGDFAFVVWDEENRRLLCVRDHVGIRPFYYCLTERLFVFASDIQVLVALAAIPLELNKFAIADYLQKWNFGHERRTFIESISKLPAATSLLITGDCEDEQNYWQPENTLPREFDSVEQCAEELRELLELVVTDRLRTDFPVHSHLSGGLDSSSISVIAARHLKKNKLKLRSFNWIPEPEPSDDPDHFEFSYAAKVAAEENIELKNISLNTEQIIQDLLEVDISLGHNLDFWYEASVQKQVNKNGGKIILSGWGGDELISHHGYEVYADMFWHGRTFEAIRRMSPATKTGHRLTKRFIRTILFEIVFPVLPGNLGDRFGVRSSRQARINPCTQPEFARFVVKQHYKTYKRPYASNRAAMLNLFNTLHIQDRIENWASTAWEHRIEYVYPLLDKRLIEFALSVPAEYFRQQGYGRYLFKESCRGLLSEEIRLQNSKTEPVRVARLMMKTAEALHAISKMLMSSSLVEREDYNEQFIDIDRFNAEVGQLKLIPENRKTELIEAYGELLKSVRLLQIGKDLKTRRSADSCVEGNEVPKTH